MKKWMTCLAAMLCCVLLLTSVYAAQAPVQILLLGTDELGEELTGESGMSRADAIYVLQLGGQDAPVKLLGIERDYLVDLPNKHGKNKLATSTFFGGPAMALDMVNGLLDLKVPYFAQIDIPSIIRAVDAMGGLDVEVEERDVEQVNGFIDGMLEQMQIGRVKAGMNHLNGHQVWAFAGVRDNNMDSIVSNGERNRRQQVIVRAALKQIHDMDMDRMLDILDAVLPSVSTNLTVNDILSLLSQVQEMDVSAFQYLRSPATEYSKKRAGMHKVVVADDMQKEIRTVHEFLGQ